MALTNTQRKKLLARIVVKATTGQLNMDTVLNRLIAAIGTNLDADLLAEADQWRADLDAAKASAQAQIAQIDADRPNIGS